MITDKGLEHLGYTNRVDFALQDDGDGVYISEWNHSDTQPTEAEITTADAEWHSQNDHKFQRKGEYPDIGDQLDDLFKAGAFSTEMTATIQAVKDKYPKE